MTGNTSPTLLVAGDSRVDAGKTTFSVGLLAALSARGLAPVGVKPRAGHDFWYDHDDFRAAAAETRLYGKDARRLAAASDRGLAVRSDPTPAGSPGTHPDSSGTGPDVPPESINPLHRLWRPTPGRTGMLGEADRTFLCDRIGRAGADDPTVVVNGTAEETGLFPPTVDEWLPVADAVRVHDVSEFNDVMAESYLPVLDRFAAAVAADPGPVVVESYGDVALPFDAAAGESNQDDGDRDAAVHAPAIDAVAVVAPTRVRLYDGDRYARACAVASGSAREGALEEHTDAVTSMVEPLQTVALPPLPAEDRTSPDRVAAAYEDAYAALLEGV
ncbi:ATPase [Halopenitus persicus]|uniref:ATPase n=1 Tax=Halopenitus persicus TaxID=1048396 RepID=UPI000BBB5B27|nr:ATPase [Halopenitus persicus]